MHVLLHHSDATVALDTTIDFPSGADTLLVSLTVKLLSDAPTSGEPMTLDLAYVDAAGDTVFKGGPISLTAAPPPASGGVNPPVQIPVTYTGPGAAATSVVISPRTNTAASGAGFTFTAVGKDAGGNVLTGTPVIWTSLDPTIATITVPAAGVGVAQSVRGTARIVAQLLTGAADTVALIVTLPASQILKSSGDAQTGTAGTTLPLPLVAKVAASDGVGIAGTTVTFAVATGGGSVGTASVVSDANGLATTTWTLGTGTGQQSVTATAATLTGSPLTFTATSTTVAAGPATSLTVSGQPSAAVAGVANAPAIVVHALDVNGMLATSFAGNVTLAIGANPGGATIGGTITVAAVAGVATFSNVTLNKVGTGYTLVASSGTLTAATSGTFNITPAAAATLAITAGNAQTGSPGATLPTALAVKVTDAFGNAVPGRSVTFAVATGGGSLGTTAATTDASGQATSVWTLGALLGTQTVTATSAGLTGSPATFTATTSSIARTWTGATSNQWTTATNWSPAGVPGAGDSVFVAVTSTAPTLSASTTVAALVLASGAPLTIAAGATLTDNGVLDATGGITGAGSVALGGSRTAKGVVTGDLAVTGSTTLNGTLGVGGNLTISSGGLILNGNAAAVTGAFTTSGTGTLTMTNAADALSITGNANFGGGSTAGLLTNGTILVMGNFTQAGAASSFAPSGSHTVTFFGSTAAQTITIANPGSSSFQNFNAGNSLGVTIASNITIAGNFSIAGPVTTGTNGLSINGTLTDPGALLTSPSISFAGSPTPIAGNTSVINASITFNSNSSLLGPLQVNGGVGINGTGSNLTISGQELLINGPFTTQNGGTLTMDNRQDTVVVVGQATFAGGAEAGKLINGGLALLQGLVVSGPGQFSASGSHLTYLVGPTACDCFSNPSKGAPLTPAGALGARLALPPQIIGRPTVASRRAQAAAAAAAAPARRAALLAQRQALTAKWPSRAVSTRAAVAAGPIARAAEVSPAKIATLSRAAAAAGANRASSRLSFNVAAPAGQIRSSNFLIQAESDSAVYVAFADTTGNQFANVRVVGSTNWQTLARAAGQVLVDTTGDVEGNGRLEVGDTLFVSPSGFVGMEAVELFGALSVSNSFFPDTALFSGASAQTMPSSTTYNNVIVNSPALAVLAEDGNEIGIIGSLFIMNSGQLRIGAPDPNCNGCLSDELFVDGALETHGNGTLRMNDANQPFLAVIDSAWFAGGSTAGLLTQGETDFFSNFRQSGSTTAYAATSPHVSFFESSLTPAITFANPQYAASHFGDLFLEDTATVLRSSVFADGSLEMDVTQTVVHAGVAGVGITSKGADVANVEFDGVTWDLQDGYAVTTMSAVDFENESPTVVQFSVERGNTIPIAATFTNWSFGTRPSSGLYVQVNQTDGGANGTLTVAFDGVFLGGNFGFVATTGGAVITGWPLGGGDDASEWASVDNLTGGRTATGGTSPAEKGMFNGEWFRPVTPLKALRF